jgi:hypothetical protein
MTINPGNCTSRSNFLGQTQRLTPFAFLFKSCMAAFLAVFTFGVRGPALTAHGSLELKQEIQIQIQIQIGL